MNSMTRRRPNPSITPVSPRAMEAEAGRPWPLLPNRSNGNGKAAGKLRPVQGVAIVPPDAVTRAIRDVGHAPIGVVGGHAPIVAEWLRQTGHEAEALAAPGKKAPREKRGSRAVKLPVIVALDCIEPASGHGAVFGQIKQMLSPQGRLIAVVPNATHASVRLAMLLGRYPLHSRDSTIAQHASTAADAERQLNEAGFTVISIERQIDSVDVLKEVGRSVPDAVIQLLADDADAMTSHFVFVAERDGPAATARLINRRLGEVAEEQQAVQRQAARLDDRVADMEMHIRRLTGETERLAGSGVPQREALAMLEARVQQLAADQIELAATAGRGLMAVERIDEQVRTIAERNAAVTSDVGRDAALREAAGRFMARTGDIAALLRGVERARYRRLIPRLRDVVTRETPLGSTLAVVSRGDDELLAFEGRRGWHFPQTERGIYAGHHPADSAAAITHVQEVRARGARYLLVPRTAFWWLDYYQEFHQYLQRNGGCLLRDDRWGALFALEGRGRSR